MRRLTRRRALAVLGGGGGGGGGGLFGGGPGSAQSYMANKKVGDKLFSELFTLKSDVGNRRFVRRRSVRTTSPAKPVTWVEKGILKAFGPNQGANTNQTLVDGRHRISRSKT